MSIRGIRRALRIPLFSRRHIEREIEVEIAHHIARRAEQLRAAGMSAEEAQREAARRFGDVCARRDECVELDRADLRQERAMDFLENTLNDVRYALRSFRRAPGFAGVALGTLIIGIAAFTAIFSYFNAVYYGALPYHDANRIVAINEQNAARRFSTFSTVSLEALPYLRGARRSFERVAAYTMSTAKITSGREAAQIVALDVDTSFIPLFALQPQAGRLITPEEILANAPVAMISDVLWRSQFGADPAVLGKKLDMGGREHAIVGVMPPGFRFPWQTDAIKPLRESPDSDATLRETDVSVIAKLRRGATRSDAGNELAVVARSLGAIDTKAYRGEQLIVRDEMVDRKETQFLPLPSLFLGAGLFLLLIACANVANLFFARAAERAGEVAVRASLGASRSRLVRLALTETLIISAIAAGAGTGLAQLLVRLWLLFIPTTGFPSWFRVAVDWHVLAFAVATTAVTTIAVGLSPALAGSRFDLVRTLKGASGGGISGRHAMRGSRRGLVIQLALSVALFVGGALLLRSYQRLARIDIGYPADQIALISSAFYDLSYGDYRSPRAQQAAEEILDRTALMRGVTGTALRGNMSRLRSEPAVLPRSTASSREYPRLIPDGDTTRAVLTYAWSVYVVSDGYFDLLGARIRAGRSFGPTDVDGGAPVAVVGAAAAKALWGAANPLGHTVQYLTSGKPMTVIGVVDDIRQLRGGRRGFSTDPQPTIYVSSRQAITRYPELLARGTGGAMTVRSAMANVVRGIDPTVSLGRETTLASQFDQSVLVMRVFGGIIGALAVSALFLSIIGIYGVVAFGVAQRTHEIGIRIALGGTTSMVLRMIAGEAARFVAIGMFIGLALAAALGRGMKSLLFGVSALDPLTYAVVAIVFGAVAFAACVIPARRVTRVDPLVALRAD